MAGDKLNTLQENWFRRNAFSRDSESRIYIARRPAQLSAGALGASMTVPFQPYLCDLPTRVDASGTVEHQTITLTAYGDNIVRFTLGMNVERENSPLLDLDPSLMPMSLTVHQDDQRWMAVDAHGQTRLKIAVQDPPIRYWSNLIAPPPLDGFTLSVLPDGRTEVAFMAWDSFVPGDFNSLALAYVVSQGRCAQVMFSLHARHDECFAGTGERFAKLDLAGRTIDLRNADAMGVNNRRAYKNVPFYLSSRGYGLLVLTSASVRLSLADLSSRAAMGQVDHDTLDLFFIGGGSIEQILYNYRRLTGFPGKVPVWSYGTWMGRMSYMTATEVEQAATQLREQQFPCDVMHIDTGWFEKDWNCDWQFSAERFPNPEKFIAKLREIGYRVSLWQLPKVAEKTEVFREARDNGYLPQQSAGPAASPAGGSDFGEKRYAGSIDLTNPQAVAWYQGLLRKLLMTGVSAIKADFGEEIELDATYRNLSPALLHNMYSLLYQRAVYEVTRQTNGDAEAIIWARAGWTGSQRYPVHWGGDAASTWDGLASSIRGGLHLGLSGFGFWSHDVGGFHGVPDFMNNWPSEELYIRWTQAAVFGSHLRFHGAQPREPYEYPAAAPIVRKWLRLRYALIPYLVQQGHRVCTSGFPFLRALILHDADPVCWHIDDQFFCGDDLLVAPVLNADGIRDIYLPEGTWIDIWTGKRVAGRQWLREVRSPLTRIPVFARYGSVVPVYPWKVTCTDQLDWRRVSTLSFDSTYRGLNRSPIGVTSEWELDL